MDQSTEPHSAAAMRILDAAANRTLEGLRVVEDIVRFEWNDANLMQQTKSLRHQISRSIAASFGDKLVRYRDTRGDVGTEVKTEQERQRSSLNGLVRANCRRIEEGLRTLSETCKLLDASLAADLENARYNAYTIEKSIVTLIRSHQSLANTRLYVLLDGQQNPEVFADLVMRLVEAGVDAIQLRDKRLSDDELLNRGVILRQLTNGTPTIFIFNDRADLAAAANADGVHLGQDDLPVAAVRPLVGDRLIGVSTHSLEQARMAVAEGADYIGVGPVFRSTTKQFEEVAGVELVAQVASEIQLPTFAIGGITEDNIPHVVQAGMRRVAVQSAFDANRQLDFKAIAANFRKQLNTDS